MKGAGETNEWRRVVFAADCDAEGNCPNCAIDYGDCDCYGPTQDGLEYMQRDGVLFARPKETTDE